MKNAKILFATLIVLLAMKAVPGQPPPNDEAQIQKLRTNIQRLIANAPPPDAPDQAGFRSVLQSLRNQLRDLLIEKRGALRIRIQNLEAPDALPEVLAHVQQLKVELQGVNDEVESITRDLGQAVGLIPLPVPKPSPEPPTELANPAPPGHEEAVKEISDEELESAAAPPEIAKAEEVATCDADGAPVGKMVSLLDQYICSTAEELNRSGEAITIAQYRDALLTILTAKLLKTKTTEGESYAAFVTEAQENRTDQQIGTEPTSTSSPSLVSKGGIPYLFGLAVENGVAEQTQTDTTLTFRFNPGGVLNLFADQGFVTGFQGNTNDPFVKFLKKTAVGLTFDTSRGDTPGIFTGKRQQLSQVSARIEFVNERDPRHKKYEADWETFVATEGVKLADDLWDATVALVDLDKNRRAFRDPALQAWFTRLAEDVAGIEKSQKEGDVAKINAIAIVIRQNVELVPVELVSEQTIDALTTFAKSDKQYTEAKNKILDKIARGKLFTLDYTTKREVDVPDTSTFNFIAATGTGARIDLTANGSFTFFHNRPPVLSLTSSRPGRFRDFQFAGQVTVPFYVGDSQFDFWFSGRYERLLENAQTLAGTIIPDTKGDIAIGQFGLNIPIPGLGMKFPVSFTFANRTELVKEKEVRGNFGFTFNWDTLFSKLKPF